MNEKTVTADDGTERMAYYGTDGEQPWDAMKRLGWAPHYAAGCVLKYLRRTKGEVESDRKKARWYLARLRELDERLFAELTQQLTQDELLKVWNRG